jgi:hypothetical protein
VACGNMTCELWKAKKLFGYAVIAFEKAVEQPRLSDSHVLETAERIKMPKRG